MKSIRTLMRALLISAFLVLGFESEATHFRYMSVNWQITATTATTRTVQFNITQSWRRSAWFGAGSAVGLTFTPIIWNYGDGSTIPLLLTVTSENTSEDWSAQ